MRYGKPIKNKKRIDPRYFLEETTTRDNASNSKPELDLDAYGKSASEGHYKKDPEANPYIEDMKASVAKYGVDVSSATPEEMHSAADTLAKKEREVSDAWSPEGKSYEDTVKHLIDTDQMIARSMDLKQKAFAAEKEEVVPGESPEFTGDDARTYMKGLVSGKYADADRKAMPNYNWAQAAAGRKNHNKKSVKNTLALGHHYEKYGPGAFDKSGKPKLDKNYKAILKNKNHPRYQEVKDQRDARRAYVRTMKPRYSAKKARAARQKKAVMAIGREKPLDSRDPLAIAGPPQRPRRPQRRIARGPSPELQGAREAFGLPPK